MPVPKEQLRSVIRRAPEETLLQDLAVETGYSSDYIARIAKTMGKKFQKSPCKRWTLDDEAQVKALYDSGVSVTEIAKRMNRSRSSIKSIIWCVRKRPVVNATVSEPEIDPVVRVKALYAEQHEWAKMVRQQQEYRRQRALCAHLL